MLQSGNVLMKVLGGGEDVSHSFLTPSTGVVKPTEVPFILGGAWAFALTCKPPEVPADFDFIPPKFESFFAVALAPESGDGDGTGINAEVAAVATIVNSFKTSGDN